MTPKTLKSKLHGVWSAAPTPLTAGMALDVGSLRRMLDHHERLGVDGLFLAGTNGEGPWMLEAQRRQLVAETVRFARGRFPIAVQITDNSAARMLSNARASREDGADIVVIAPPFFHIAGRPDPLALYLEVIRQSPLPVGIYDRGVKAPVVVTDQAMRTICAEPKVILVKDSSADMHRLRVHLASKRHRPDLGLLNGWEMNCIPYLKAGYDGLLLGGGVFNGLLARWVLEAVRHEDWPCAEDLQERMNRLMYDVYGGKKIRCWLAGEKHLLVQMGIFKTWANYPGFPLTASCRQAIARALRREKQVLLP